MTGRALSGIAALAAVAAIAAALPAAADTTPSPSPTPSATPSPAPTASPIPSPSASPSAAPTPSPSPTTTPTPTPPPTPPPLVAATSASGPAQPFTVAASSMDVTGFSYLGNATVSTANGPVTVMVFTASSASISGLSIAVGCLSRVTWTTAGRATAPSGLALEATRFQATIGGVAVDWAPAATGSSTVPPQHPLPGDAGTIGGPITVTSVGVTAPTFQLATLSTVARIC